MSAPLPFAVRGALAGIAAALGFTLLHQLLISSIWFALPAMLVAGALCGGALAWSYGEVVRRFDRRRWLAWNAAYVALLVALGVASRLVFTPMTTIAALLASQEPPRELIGRALPLTGAFVAAAVLLWSLVMRASWRGVLSLVVTAVLVVGALGLNISILGFVEVQRGEVRVLGEVLVLLLGLAGLYAALMLRWAGVSRGAEVSRAISA